MCVHVCACTSVYVDVMMMCAWVNMCVHAYRGQQSALGVISLVMYNCFLDTGFLSGLELAK